MQEMKRRTMLNKNTGNPNLIYQNSNNSFSSSILHPFFHHSSAIPPPPNASCTFSSAKSHNSNLQNHFSSYENSHIAAGPSLMYYSDNQITCNGLNKNSNYSKYINHYYPPPPPPPSSLPPETLAAIETPNSICTKNEITGNEEQNQHTKNTKKYYSYSTSTSNQNMNITKSKNNNPKGNNNMNTINLSSESSSLSCNANSSFVKKSVPTDNRSFTSSCSNINSQTVYKDKQNANNISYANNSNSCNALNYEIKLKEVKNKACNDCLSENNNNNGFEVKHKDDITGNACNGNDLNFEYTNKKKINCNNHYCSITDKNLRNKSSFSNSNNNNIIYNNNCVSNSEYCCNYNDSSSKKKKLNVNTQKIEKIEPGEKVMMHTQRQQQDFRNSNVNERNSITQSVQLANYSRQNFCLMGQANENKELSSAYYTTASSLSPHPSFYTPATKSYLSSSDVSTFIPTPPWRKRKRTLYVHLESDTQNFIQNGNKISNNNAYAENGSIDYHCESSRPYINDRNAAKIMNRCYHSDNKEKLNATKEAKNEQSTNFIHKNTKLMSNTEKSSSSPKNKNDCCYINELQTNILEKQNTNNILQSSLIPSSTTHIPHHLCSSTSSIYIYHPSSATQPPPPPPDSYAVASSSIPQHQKNCCSNAVLTKDNITKSFDNTNVICNNLNDEAENTLRVSRGTRILFKNNKAIKNFSNNEINQQPTNQAITARRCIASEINYGEEEIDMKEVMETGKDIKAVNVQRIGETEQPNTSVIL